MSARRTVCVAPNPIDEAVPVSIPPTGTIITYAGNTIPQGYLNCNGAGVSRNTYATLLGAIGTTYGAGDGASQTVTSGSTTSTATGTFSSSYISLNAGSVSTPGTTLTITTLTSGSYPVVGSILSGGTSSDRIADGTRVEEVLVAGSSYRVSISQAAAPPLVTASNPVVAITLNLNAGENLYIPSGTSGVVTSTISAFNNIVVTAGVGTTSSVVNGTATGIIGGLTFSSGTTSIRKQTPTTFNLPNAAGRTIRAVGSSVGTTGTTTVTLGQRAGDDGTIMTYDQIAQHSHLQQRGGAINVISSGSTTVQGTSDNINSDGFTLNTVYNQSGATGQLAAPNPPNKIPTLNQYIGFYTLISYL